MRLVRLPVLGITLALAVAAPAAAIPGGGLASALRTDVTVASSRDAASHTCQAGRNHEKTKLTVAGDARKQAVVACEQPPKSELITPSLKQIAANAASTLG